MTLRFLIYFLFSVLILSSCSTASYPIKEPRQMMTLDLITLASDDMEGREVGTAGEQKAAKYIVNRFKDIGLTPAGDHNTFYQRFTRKANKNPHGDDSGTGPDIEVTNVIGMIDNHALYTVVIGAHYDHLGYGDENSLHTGERAIHNGADDNASGVSGLINLAESIKKGKLKNYNYVFIAFSGEEQGLWGSNYYVNKSGIDVSKINYMLNMDMIGRLNSERQLAVSGVGTSPVFGQVLDKIKKPEFKIKRDSSGLGPSDHASFYNAGVPVIALFTGQHKDYHKPSDDFPYINYSGLIDVVKYAYAFIYKMDKKKKVPFTKTRDESQQRMSFNVTLGIMPDYLYDGGGLKIDGVKEVGPAAQAGIMKGDIITRMGDLDINDMNAYMHALTVFKPGDTVEVSVLRDGHEVKLSVHF